MSHFLKNLRAAIVPLVITLIFAAGMGVEVVRNAELAHQNSRQHVFACNAVRDSNADLRDFLHKRIVGANQPPAQRTVGEELLKDLHDSNDATYARCLSPETTSTTTSPQVSK